MVQDNLRLVERKTSLTSHEERIFNATLEELIQDVKKNKYFKQIPDVAAWVEKILLHTVRGGKEIRGRSMVSTYAMLNPGCTDADIKLACILGWSIEIFQACYLLADDIMDGSQTRRKKPCWHLLDGIGLSAINDAFILNGFMQYTIRQHFKTKPYYKYITRLFNDTYLRTSLGQCADTRNSNEIYTNFSMSVYSRIVKYKTSYYTFCLPVQCAIIMSGITDRRLLDRAEDVLLEIGHLFQVQDDYLDCFGDPELYGKIGNDIQENKCSWMVVRALEIANNKQKIIIKENYGRGKNSHPQNVQRVKNIYKELKMDREFKVFETISYMRITAMIEDLPKALPKQIFSTILDLIYCRQK